MFSILVMHLILVGDGTVGISSMVFGDLFLDCSLSDIICLEQELAPTARNLGHRKQFAYVKFKQ